MVASLKFTLTKTRKRWEAANLSAGELNDIFRASLRATAEQWINTMLPQHFGNEAMNRYGYKFRSKRHLARKAWLRPDLSPPAPLEYTGELKSYVMGNATSGQMLNRTKTISTGPSQKNPNGKLRMTIPVQVPHPLNPKNAGELSRVIRSERRELDRLFYDTVSRKLSQSPKVIEHEKIKAA